MATVFDDRHCGLGEGPLWHPQRAELFWLDIPGKRMLSRGAAGPSEWSFDEMVSAAGWVDRDTLLLASETGLFRFGLASGSREKITDLEVGSPTTRSNDGRADAQGGFWIGTMGKRAEAGAGAIYRYYRGRLEQLYDGITVSNAICFAPDGRRAYFSDTPTHRIMAQDLDDQGWPKGPPQVFVDLSPEGLYPDGAVVDSEGALWNAQWGAGRVARYRADGWFDTAIRIPARLSTCPAFGGSGLAALYVTSARGKPKDADENQGRTFEVDPGITGLPEHRVIL